MTDVLSAVPTLPNTAPATVAGPVGPNASPGGTAGGPGASFDQTLGAFLNGQDAALDQPAQPSAVGDGQALAADGKDLPAATPDDGQQPDPALTPAWLSTFVLPPLAAPPLPTPDSAPTIVATELAIATPVSCDPTPALPQAASPKSQSAAANQSVPATPAKSDAAAPDTKAKGAPTPQPVAPQTIEALVAAAIGRSTAPTAKGQTAPSPGTASTDAQPVALARIEAAATAIAVSATPQPAGQVFAAAIAAASNWRDRGDRTPDRDVTDGTTTILASGTPIALQERAIVHATGDAQGAALDLTKDSGLQRVVDHIETLRDDANATDTRIRLVPDALGGVDIAVRQDGDRVHVHFTADHDATRALIADAQPRLTELAAARGIRIGDTSVGTGTTSGGNNAPQQSLPTPRIARTPAPVTVAADSTADTITTNQRLA